MAARDWVDGDSQGLSGPGKLILLLLHSQSDAPLPGRTHLQKEAFVISHALPGLSQDLGFEPHLMGPYSSALADEAEQLELSELVVEDGGSLRITERGRSLASSLERETGRTVLAKIAELKALMNDMTRDELLAFVYFGLADEPLEPESEEYTRVSALRQRLARSLLRKGKVSMSRAAEIAGVPLERFLMQAA